MQLDRSSAWKLHKKVRISTNNFSILLDRSNKVNIDCEYVRAAHIMGRAYIFSALLDRSNKRFIKSE